ncbi:2-amino-4-hydroxy-6-hydroxymethyldihydropteridinediphosphokinase [Gammaproteobacteria bacterium]
MVTTYLSLGSNVEPRRHLPTAIREMNTHFGPLHLSPVYESVAIGFSGEHFLNLVAAFETDAEPAVIHSLLRALEESHGRVRGSARFAPRTLDVDLILYGNLVSAGPPAFPRDEILRYAFVLRPLADLAPDVRHPITGMRYADLWAGFDASDQSLWQITLDLN